MGGVLSQCIQTLRDKFRCEVRCDSDCACDFNIVKKVKKVVKKIKEPLSPLELKRDTTPTVLREEKDG